MFDENILYQAYHTIIDNIDSFETEYLVSLLDSIKRELEDRGEKN